MKKTSRFIARFLKYSTLASSLGFIATTLIQIYARFFMDNAPPWTEEAARFFFVYAMAFAAGLAMKDNYYVQFEMLFDRLGPKTRSRINRLVLFSTVLLFLFLAFYGVRFVILGLPERSPSLALPMAIAFGSMVIMGLSVSYFALRQLLKKL